MCICVLVVGMHVNAVACGCQWWVSDLLELESPVDCCENPNFGVGYQTSVSKRAVNVLKW